MIDSPAVNALFGLATYELASDSAFDRMRKFGRVGNPLYYWFLVAVETIFGVVFLSRALPHS